MITVAASTQTRAFQSTLTLTGGADTLALDGSSITAGISAPTPVVMAEDVPGYNDTACATPLPPGSVDRHDRRLRQRATAAVGRVAEGLQRRCRAAPWA